MTKLFLYLVLSVGYTPNPKLLYVSNVQVVPVKIQDILPNLPWNKPVFPQHNLIPELRIK